MMMDFQKPLQENYSKVIHCTNSQAIENNKTTLITPTIKCNYCSAELEQVGNYMNGHTFLNKWRTSGEYERCTCNGSKKYWVESDKAEEAKQIRIALQEANRVTKENFENLMKESNLGERFRTRTFETFKVNPDNNNAFIICEDYADRFKEIKGKGIGLLIYGSYGAGKTHLAAAVTHSLIKQNQKVIFGTLISLLGKIKASYNDEYTKENENTIINKYLNCDLLVIDDLGKEKTTDWMMEKLYYIINSRYEGLKPIIITSNYSDIKLMERLTVNGNSGNAEAIVSRLAEICQGVDMNKCKDHRKQ